MGSGSSGPYGGGSTGSQPYAPSYHVESSMKKHDIENCAYIGDTQGDLEACREANIPFIFCGYGLGQAESYDEKIDSIDQLLEM